MAYITPWLMLMVLGFLSLDRLSGPRPPHTR